jgi:hypothetical protein
MNPEYRCVIISVAASEAIAKQFPLGSASDLNGPIGHPGT